MTNLLPVITIFVGSFLSFAVEPLIGRTLLPAFGGTAAVWVVCLCAFQVLMLAGYFYAHLLGSGESGKVRGLKPHLVLLVCAAVWVCVIAFARRHVLALAGVGGCAPLEVLLCVLALVGVPFVLLCANSSLVQVLAGGNYRLYAVSNIGSIAGLVAYPFVLEPHVGLTQQWFGFGVGIFAYAVLMFLMSRAGNGVCGLSSGGRGATRPTSGNGATRSSRVLWLLIPASTCFALNAITTHVTLDVMPLPLMWVVILGLFLLSYVIGFSDRGAKFARGIGWLVPLLILGAVLAISIQIRGMTYVIDLTVCLLLVFAASTYLHGWLYALRPEGKLLTRYYLFNALGGAIGGILTGLVAPMVFKTVLEYPIALFLLLGLSAWGMLTMHPKRVVRIVFALIVLVAAGAFAKQVFFPNRGGRTVVLKERGFFGTVVVTEMKARSQNGKFGVMREFIHGNTVHGLQAQIPGKERMPTAYYTDNACGWAIKAHPKYRTGEPMRVNLVGLGVGVLFAYGRTNDYYRAYEISQDALDIATNTNLFTFVSDCPAKKDVVLCDARKGLEAELAAGVEPYDVIVIDAFTGDNIPYHLSTVEAFDLYFKLLKPDGILCVNVSNWHLELLPYIRSLGDRYNVALLGFQSAPTLERLSFGAKAVFFCLDPRKLAPPPADPGVQFFDFRIIPPMSQLPTDEKGSFVELISM